MGRPTDYTPEMVQRAKEYLDGCEDVEIDRIKQANTEKGYEMYETKLKVNLPTIQGLARYLGVNQDTVYEWAKIYPEFSETLEDIRNEQAQRLLNKGLSGDYNSTIAKLILSSNHGFRERTDLTSDNKQIIDDESSQLAKQAITKYLNRGNVAGGREKET